MKISLSPLSKPRIPVWASAEQGTRRVPAANSACWKDKENAAMKNATLHRRLLLSILASIAVTTEVSRAQTPEGTDLSIELVDPNVLRVCPHPPHLPFSNDKGDGFENQLPELFAHK